MIAVATGVAAAALSVSPSRLRLSGGSRREITVVNVGTAVVDVDARPTGLGVDARGRPTVANGRGRAAAAWLRLRPRRLVLGPGGSGVLTVSANVPSAATAGDHAALVLFTAQPRRLTGIGVRMRIGVAVFVRVAGPIVHHLQILALRRYGRVLEAEIANRGNAVERPRMRITLRRNGHVLARIEGAVRTLLPQSRVRERFRPSARLRGRLTAVVGLGPARRAFRLRL